MIKELLKVTSEDQKLLGPLQNQDVSIMLRHGPLMIPNDEHMTPKHSSSQCMRSMSNVAIFAL